MDNNTLAPARILGLQKRIYTIGRIRLGIKGPSGAPKKIETFRLTSPDRGAIEAAAKLYGGEVMEWRPTETRLEWQVVTTAREIPFLISPVPVSQSMEDWSGGECQRRCDGVTEKQSGKPCICESKNKRICKPTTRFSIILQDLPGWGVWMIESHGWTCATELTATADLLLQYTMTAKRPIPAVLVLEDRQSRKGGVTRKFVVPVIRIKYTPAQLLQLASKGAAALETGAETPERIKAFEQNAGETDLRKKYFALARELAWPNHEGEGKLINYRVWSQWLGRLIGPANGGSKFIDADWSNLIVHAEAILDNREDEPLEYEKYRIGEHPGQLGL